MGTWCPLLEARLNAMVLHFASVMRNSRCYTTFCSGFVKKSAGCWSVSSCFTFMTPLAGCSRTHWWVTVTCFSLYNSSQRWGGHGQLCCQCAQSWCLTEFLLTLIEVLANVWTQFKSLWRPSSLHTFNKNIFHPRWFIPWVCASFDHNCFPLGSIKLFECFCHCLRCWEEGSKVSQIEGIVVSFRNHTHKDYI